MILRSFLTFLTAAMLIYLSSCSSSHSCIPGSATASIYFEDFDSATLEKIIVSHYNSLNQKQDSTVYRLSDYQMALRHDDTNPNLVHWPYKLSTGPGEDIGIKVSATGKTYRITGLSKTDATVKQSFMGNDEVCYDVVTGYYLNGTYYSTGLTENDTYNGRNAWIAIRP